MARVSMLRDWFVDVNDTVFSRGRITGVIDNARINKRLEIQLKRGIGEMLVPGFWSIRLQA